jgi:hypothetical protein
VTVRTLTTAAAEVGNWVDLEVVLGGVDHDAEAVGLRGLEEPAVEYAVAQELDDLLLAHHPTGGDSLGEPSSVPLRKRAPPQPESGRSAGERL